MVPRPAVCASEQNGLRQAGVICAYRLSRGGDLAEIVGAFDLRGWVQRVGEPLGVIAIAFRDNMIVQLEFLPSREEALAAHGQLAYRRRESDSNSTVK